jgi:L-idonate 5-dehydrogenase
MRAAVLHAPHDLRVEQGDDPQPGPGQVLVRVGAGGVCGSDLHYFRHGGFGAVRLREPMILGHEVAGTIEALGADVDGLTVGQKAAIDPSLPCGHCRFCREGLRNQCLNMQFYGSAMRFPHVQGGFREHLVCDASQIHPVPDHVPLSEAAFAEPLAVCLHALARAGGVAGKRVLVTGAGPIGCLAVIAARRCGAVEIVATDILGAPLALAARVGANRVIDTARQPDALSAYGRDKGTFDVLLEASGSLAALAGALPALRPRAVAIQIGWPGEGAVPLHDIIGCEIDLRGTFRFEGEFATAVAFIAAGLVDVTPLLTRIFPLDRVAEAFALAGDKSASMKVQISFDPIAVPTGGGA